MAADAEATAESTVAKMPKKATSAAVSCVKSKAMADGFYYRPRPHARRYNFRDDGTRSDSGRVRAGRSLGPAAARGPRSAGTDGPRSRDTRSAEPARDAVLVPDARRQHQQSHGDPRSLLGGASAGALLHVFRASHGRVHPAGLCRCARGALADLRTGRPRRARYGVFSTATRPSGEPRRLLYTRRIAGNLRGRTESSSRAVGPRLVDGRGEMAGGRGGGTAVGAPARIWSIHAVGGVIGRPPLRHPSGDHPDELSACVSTRRRAVRH